ncbi:MAG: hypothetical protein ABSA21_14075 [Candidatus Limnocylindrales bacterium]|jgi:hypothetical protein
MNAPRRLRALEESLSPTEAVLRWLAEARAFGGFQEYAVATLEAPEGAAPLERIIARVESAARREHPRGSRATLAAAIANRLEDAVFRYELVLRLNADILELSERLRPRLRTLVATLGERIVAATLGRAETVEARTTPTAVDGQPAGWHEQVDELVATIAIEDQARTLLEHHYFGGSGVLFADVAQGWRTVGGQVREIAVGEAPAPHLVGSGRRRRVRGTRSSPSASLTRRVQARAGAIAADARLAALMMLGEQARATDLLRSRVGLGADELDLRLAVRALERCSHPRRGSEPDETAEQAAATAHPLDGLSAAEQARQLRLIATELEPLP